MYKREQLGVITRNSNNAFPLPKIATFEGSRTVLSDYIDKIFCAIDPAGGGSSAMAIVSGVLLNNRTEVVVRHRAPAHT